MLLNRLVSLPWKNLDRYKRTIYLVQNQHVIQVISQIRLELDDTIDEVAEIRTLIQQQLKMTRPMRLEG